MNFFAWPKHFNYYYSIIWRGCFFQVPLNDHVNCPPLVRQKFERREFQFTTIGGCLYQLYWTIFGYSRLVFASKVYPYWTIHTLVGSILFILFNFLAVVVLLNVLVGMITKTLDSIEANIDTEWKFSRSGIYADFISEESRVPSPFNIFPSVRMALKMLNKLIRLLHGSNALAFATNPEYKAKMRKRQLGMWQWITSLSWTDNYILTWVDLSLISIDAL